MYYFCCEIWSDSFGNNGQIILTKNLGLFNGLFFENWNFFPSLVTKIIASHEIKFEYYLRFRIEALKILHIYLKSLIYLV